MKISMFFVFVTFQVFGKVTNLPTIQCACQQIISQTECNNWNCQWVQISTTPNIGYCNQVSCQQLNQYQCYNEHERCYYQQSGSQVSQVCYDFSTCEDIQLADGQTCQEANPKCIEIDQNKCVGSGDSCKSLSQTQCNNSSFNTLTNEGICYWNGSSCVAITQCEEVQNEILCSNKWLKNACYWTGTKCVNLTCSLIFQSNTCRFVQTTPLNGGQIQSCIWNGQQCINATSDQLNQEYCASNTNYLYRWIPINIENGICAQCHIYQYEFQNECECNQLFQQSECNNSQFCQWNNNTCTTLLCSDYSSQQQCAQVHGCYWNALKIPSLCLPYYDCNQILGKNNSACISASIYCPGSDGTYCQYQYQLPECKDIFKNTTILPNICYNSIGSDGYCTYDKGNNSCINIKYCSQLQSQSLCNQFDTICIWRIGASPSYCQQKSCNDFHTQSSCSFIQNSMNTNIISYCSWNPDTQQCTPFNNSINYDINQCYTQTGRTYHWSQPQQQYKGLCVPCKFTNLLNVKSKCECNDIENFNDCISSYPNCFWNSSTQSCNILQCDLITNQAQCVLNQQCFWNTTNTTKCSLINNNSTSSFCSTLSGNTQQECLSQSILCAGFNTDKGRCSSDLNNCKDYNQFYECFGSFGLDGLCQWSQINSSCLSVNNCTEIKNQNICNQIVNTCYWDSISNCTQYNCTTLYNQTQRCDYYLSQPNQQYKVELCYLNGDVCNSTSKPENLNSSDCYYSSGRTARWTTEGGCTLCYCQLISFLIIILISIQ